jgi:hypothetical protein
MRPRRLLYRDRNSCSLSKAAKILGKGMEEVIRDVKNYLKQLQDLSPMALEAATH